MGRPKKWTNNRILFEVKQLIMMLALEHVPDYAMINKYIGKGCGGAVNQAGGIKWLSEELGLPTKKEYGSWTKEEVLKEIRRCMDLHGIHNRMLTVREIRKYSSVYGILGKFGGLEVLAKELGVPYIRTIGGKPTNTVGVENATPVGPYTMEEVKPSRAFVRQKRTGVPYGELQRMESLKEAGKIDVSAYAGMKPYSERISNG